MPGNTSNSRMSLKARAQSAGHLTRKSEVLGSIPGLATYFRFSFKFEFKRADKDGGVSIDLSGSREYFLVTLLIDKRTFKSKQ